MKTKRVIRSWVVYLLIYFNGLNVSLMCGEWQNLKLQILYSIFSFGFMFISIKLIKNSKLIKECDL